MGVGECTSHVFTIRQVYNNTGVTRVKVAINTNGDSAIDPIAHDIGQVVTHRIRRKLGNRVFSRSQTAEYLLIRINTCGIDVEIYHDGRIIDLITTGKVKGCVGTLHILNDSQAAERLVGERTNNGFTCTYIDTNAIVARIVLRLCKVAFGTDFYLGVVCLAQAGNIGDFPTDNILFRATKPTRLRCKTHFFTGDIIIIYRSRYVTYCTRHAADEIEILIKIIRVDGLLADHQGTVKDIGKRAGHGLISFSHNRCI